MSDTPSQISFESISPHDFEVVYCGRPVAVSIELLRQSSKQSRKPYALLLFKDTVRFTDTEESATCAVVAEVIQFVVGHFAAKGKRVELV